MAKGKEHQKSNRKLITFLIPINIIALITLILTIGLATTSPISLLFSGLLGILFGYLFGPDLDQQKVKTINETELPIFIYYLLRSIYVPYFIANAIKQFLIYVIVWFWAIYSMIPHRSPLSHSYVFSTILRELYFFGMIFIPYMIFHNNIIPLIWLYENPLLAVPFIINHIIIDANHLRLDNI